MDVFLGNKIEMGRIVEIQKDIETSEKLTYEEIEALKDIMLEK